MTAFTNRHTDEASAGSDGDAVGQVRRYHRETKHAPSRYAPGPGFLDWETQPNPFRRYAGARTVPLPLNGVHSDLPFDQLYENALPAKAFDESHLSLFIELSMGLSAWKQIGADRWALRHNPSSGNLHPTEAYLVLLQPLNDALPPGIYHYAPHEHALECRTEFDTHICRQLAEITAKPFAAIGLASIFWREEWKYGARALRYCLHDTGHALASIRYAAATLGWHIAIDSMATDEDLRTLLGLHSFPPAVEPEFPELLAFAGEIVPKTAVINQIRQLILQSTSSFVGTANQLSVTRTHWPPINDVLPALEKHLPLPPVHSGVTQADMSVSHRAPETQTLTGEAVIRRRRSAQHMKADTSISREQFLHMLQRTVPEAPRLPFDGFPFQPAVQLVLFVHTVRDLAPGLYALIRSQTCGLDFIQSCQNPQIKWQPVAGVPLSLYALSAPTDVRRLAAQISCGQSIAGESAFSVGMVADVDETIRREGPWAYRRLFWEAGLIGQLLYLEAEAMGVSGTGIGCFFDDSVHQLLGLPNEGRWQSIYHFTVGTAIPDARLTTLPGYHHLQPQPRRGTSQAGQ